jgi:hypothetical protein
MGSNIIWNGKSLSLPCGVEWLWFCNHLVACSNNKAKLQQAIKGYENSDHNKEIRAKNKKSRAKKKQHAGHANVARVHHLGGCHHCVGFS